MKLIMDSLYRMSIFDYKSFIYTILYISFPAGPNHSYIHHIFIKNNNDVENFKASVNQKKNTIDFTNICT